MSPFLTCRMNITARHIAALMRSWKRPETRQCLPVGIQDFETLRSENFYCVDKTPLIRRLVDGGHRYFLSRPRRLGRSLTLKVLFAGRKDLFNGLNIHDHRDLSITHPVPRLSCSLT